MPTEREKSLDRQRRFAWAQYYNAVNQEHQHTIEYIERLQATINEPTIPIHLKNEIEEMANTMKKLFECPICLDVIPLGKLEITNCGHKYCKECLDGLLAQTTNTYGEKVSPTCAVCRKKLK